MKLNKLLRLRKWIDSYKYKCKNGCYECCTAISFIESEEKLMKKELLKNGYKTPPNGKGDEYCEYLTEEGRCSVYNQRPIVCRGFSDIKFVFSGGGKKIATTSCSYGDENKYVDGNKDFMDYGFESLEKPIYNKNTENVLKKMGMGKDKNLLFYKK